MDRIDVKLPFIYTAEVKKPGKRNFETVEFGDWTEVSVSILSESEAPMAARWTSNN